MTRSPYFVHQNIRKKFYIHVANKNQSPEQCENAILTNIHADIACNARRNFEFCNGFDLFVPCKFLKYLTNKCISRQT